MHIYDGGSSATGNSTSETLLYVADLVTDSDETLATAWELAETNRVSLELIHVVDVEQVFSNPDAQMGIQHRLETLAHRLKNLKREAAFHLLFGSPEDVIPKRASEVRAKLIAFGRGGSSPSTRQQRLIRRIMARVSCPIVIIPANAA